MPSEKPWPLEAERSLWSDICTPGRHEHSFWWFVRIAWGAHWYLQSRTAKTPWLVERVHRPYCDWLQGHVLAWKEARRNGQQTTHQLISLLPRDTGKTVIATKALGLWMHLDEPDLSTAIGSETFPKARKFQRAVRMVIEGREPSAWFTWLYGNWYDKSRVWTDEELVHGYRQALSLSEPSFGSFGVETGITGYHPDVVLHDDPVTQEKLREGGNWLEIVRAHMKSLPYALKTDGFFHLATTRYAEDDAAGVLLDTGGIQSWSGMPATEKQYECTETGQWHVYFFQVLDETQQPTLPEVWWLEKIAQRRREDEEFFAAQLMNMPLSSEHMPLTREQIERLRMPRTDLPTIEYATIHLDTAFADEKKLGEGDESAVVVWLHDLRDTGIVYLDRCLHSNQWRSEQLIESLIRIVRDLKARGIRARAITDEKEMAGKTGMFARLVQAAFAQAQVTCPPFILLNRAHRTKDMRLRRAAGYWLEGYVRLLSDAPGRDVLERQMLALTRGVRDDVADAAADVFADTTPAIWRRPTSGQDAAQIWQAAPGDEYLKGGVSYEELWEKYAEQHPGHEGGLWDEWGNVRSEVSVA